MGQTKCGKHKESDPSDLELQNLMYSFLGRGADLPPCGLIGQTLEKQKHLKLVFWAETLLNLYCELEKYFWLKLCPIFSPELLAVAEPAS